jgi:hypothetical protein
MARQLHVGFVKDCDPVEWQGCDLALSWTCIVVQLASCPRKADSFSLTMYTSSAAILSLSQLAIVGETGLVIQASYVILEENMLAT